MATKTLRKWSRKLADRFDMRHRSLEDLHRPFATRGRSDSLSIVKPQIGDVPNYYKRNIKIKMITWNMPDHTQWDAVAWARQLTKKGISRWLTSSSLDDPEDIVAFVRQDSQGEDNLDAAFEALIKRKYPLEEYNSHVFRSQKLCQTMLLLIRNEVQGSCKPSFCEIAGSSIVATVDLNEYSAAQTVALVSSHFPVTRCSTEQRVEAFEKTRAHLDMLASSGGRQGGTLPVVWAGCFSFGLVQDSQEDYLSRALNEQKMPFEGFTEPDVNFAPTKRLSKSGSNSERSSLVQDEPSFSDRVIYGVIGKRVNRMQNTQYNSIASTSPKDCLSDEEHDMVLSSIVILSPRSC